MKLTSLAIFKIKDTTAENIMPTLCFVFCCISLFFTLINVRFARESFFIASYIAIIMMLFGKEKILSYWKTFPLLICLLGIVKFIWFIIFYHNNFAIAVESAHLQTGKRLMLAAFIIAYLADKKENILNKKRILAFTLGAAFALITFSGLYQLHLGIERVSFFNSRATDAAYMYSCLSLALIFFILKIERMKNYLLTLAVFFISFAMIIATGTRSAFILHPILFITILLFNSHGRHKKAIFLLGAAAILMLLFLSKNYIKERVIQTENEYLVYKQSDGNTASSLGTRLTMWQVGLAVFQHNLWGMSQEQRYQQMQAYTKQHASNQSALDYAMVHLHNESIETATQQGVLGLLVLWAFYITTSCRALASKNTLLLLAVLSIFLYGLSDVVLISREQTIFFSLIILMAYLFPTKAAK